MPNTPADFPHQVTTNSLLGVGGEANFNLGQANPAGAVAIGSATRFWPLYEHTTASPHIRMYKSTDTGTNWFEVDSGNAIALITNTNSRRYLFYNHVIDTRSSTIYVAHWNTSSNVAMKAFDCAAGTWGSDVASSYAYGTATAGTGAQGIYNEARAFGIAIDYSGDSVWITYNEGFLISTEQSGRLVYGKYSVGGASWGALSTFAGTAADGLSWNQLGLTALQTASDTTSNVYVYFAKQYFGQGYQLDFIGGTGTDGTGTWTNITITNGGTGFGTFTYAVRPRVTFSQSGTLFVNASTIGGPLDTVTGTATYKFTSTNTLGDPTSIVACNNVLLITDLVAGGTDTIGTLTNSGNSTYKLGFPKANGTYAYTPVTFFANNGPDTGKCHSLRGIAGGWDYTRLTGAESDIGTNTSLMMDMEQISGIDHLVYGYTPDNFTSMVFTERTSTGSAGAWSSGTAIGTIDETGANFATQDVMCLYNNQGTLGFGMPYGAFFGMGYWEGSGTTPPAAFNFLYIPQYTKSHNRPGH